MKRSIFAVVAFATAHLAFAQLVIEKSLPVSFGVDLRGWNNLEGRFIDARVYSRAWTESEVAAYNGIQSVNSANLVWSGTPKVGDRCDAVGKADFTNGFTFACCVVLDKIGGRLIDNATSGGRDGKKLFIPAKFNIPADGIVRSSTGIPFRLDAGNGENAVFTSLYDQLPAIRLDRLCPQVNGIDSCESC